MFQFDGKGNLPFMTFTLSDLKTTFKLLADDKSFGYRKRKETKVWFTLDKTDHYFSEDLLILDQFSVIVTIFY